MPSQDTLALLTLIIGVIAGRLPKRMTMPKNTYAKAVNAWG